VEREEAVKRCPQCGRLDRWINVKQMPSKNDTEHLVTLEGGFVRIAYYYSDSKGRHFSDPLRPWNNEYDLYVTHWMELPKAAAVRRRR
jgi:hypothetical protein